MIAVFSGLLAGSLHVVSGPDHLAAVAPLTVNDWRRAVSIGLKWGLGHSSGVLFVGLVALLTREVLPIETLSGWAESLVGILLIAIGLWGFRKALYANVHVHEHSHDGSTHVHYHVHAAGHDPRSRSPHAHGHAAFMVGTLHGMAGGSHFFGVIPALVFATRFESIAYLCAYGLGTIGAMIFFSYGLGLLARRLEREAIGYRAMALTISTLAVLVGVYWLIA